MNSNVMRMQGAAGSRRRLDRFLNAGWLGILFALLVAGQAMATPAAFNVTVSSGPSGTGYWSGNVWTGNGAGAVVSVSEIETRLNSGAVVTIQSLSGDLTVASAVTWSSNAALTLLAAGDVHVNANISASGNSAGLTITPDYYPTGTHSYTLGNGAKITLSGTTPTLSISGTTYTVINTVTALQNMQLAGIYALGSDIDASATTTWNSGAGFAPVGTTGTGNGFTGRFDGLGHSISGLFINRSSTDFIGLFGSTSGAVISDVGLVGVNIVGQSATGALAGAGNSSTISRVYVTGTVTGIASVGGLIGSFITGTSLSSSYNAASVTSTQYHGSVGGLVGDNSASIIASYNSGTVSGGYAGGLVGANTGTVDSCFNSGKVSGTGTTPKSGGLVGYHYSGAVVTKSYWDQTKTSNGVGFNAGTFSASGLSTANAKVQSNFPNLDFSATWKIYDSHTYPLVKAFLKPVTVTANNASVIYGDGVTAWTGGNGVVWSDPSVVSSLSGTVTYGGTSQGAATAGTYTITTSGYWSDDQQGWDITAVDGVLTIVYPKVTSSFGGPPGNPGGSISPSTPLSAPTGSIISFTLTPDPNYFAVYVSGCGASLTGSNTCKTGPLTADCNVFVVFANSLVNGSCGSSNGLGGLITAPTTNLCGWGAPSAVTGSGPWNWTCSGVYGGMTASCSANIKTWNVTPSAGAGGTISSSTPQSVNNNATTAFTITPDPGFRILSATGCNGSVAGSVYTTGPITADCSVSVQFVDPGTMTAPGNALDFDGVNDVVTVPDANALDLTTNYTIEAWIKPRAFTSIGGIVSKYASDPGYMLTLGGSGNYDSIVFDGLETAGGVLQLDTWQHVAAVNENGTRHLYVNGAEQALSGYLFAVLANTAPVMIGTWDTHHFNGAIDEVRIWNTARTPSQILDTMGVIVDADAAGLVAYYRFDQGTAGGDNSGKTVLYDRTANRLDGTLSGFALNGATSNWIVSGGSFTDAPHTVTPSAGPHGSISPNTPQLVSHNTTTSFTVTPADGYAIDSVTGCNGNLSGNTYTTGAITSDCAVTASFTVNPVNGSCGTSNGQTLTAVPAANLCAAGSASAVSGTGHPWTWTCTGANGGTTADCSANIQTYTLTFSTDGNGTLSGSTSQTVDHGASASEVTAQPSAGYHFVNWTGTNGFATTSTNPLIVSSATATMDITANFSANAVDGSCGSSNNSTSTTAPSTNLCAAGTSSAVSGSGPWTWTCTGLNGGTTANCSASITPTGDLTGDGTVDAADALKALRIASGLDSASSSDLEKGDVAPLVNGAPQSDGKIDIGDVVVILRKAVGLVTW